MFHHCWNIRFSPTSTASSCATIAFSNYVANPPWPPLSAVPQPVESAPAATTSKHALPQPAPEGPSTKQICRKPFPKSPDGSPCVEPPAVSFSQVGTPILKGPRAEMVPPSFEAQQAPPAQVPRPLSPCEQQPCLLNLCIQTSRQRTMKHFDGLKAPTSSMSKSMTWTRSALLWSNHPRIPIRSSRPDSDLQLLRKQVPVLTEEQLYKIFST